MTIIQVLLGEHGAMYPLLERIENTASSADLQGLKIQASLLQSTLVSHADIEDALLRPVILKYLPQPAPAADGKTAPTDHEIIVGGLAQVLAAVEAQEARRWLLDTVAKTRKHFLKEETIIFGIAGRELSHQRQDELGAEWARMRGVLVN
jgi:hemerythrin-like domain-containing protein